MCAVSDAIPARSGRTRRYTCTFYTRIIAIGNNARFSIDFLYGYRLMYSVNVNANQLAKLKKDNKSLETEYEIDIYNL